MLFSERYGHKKVPMLKKDEMPDSLRTRIWNLFYLEVFVHLDAPLALSSFIPKPLFKFTLSLLSSFFSVDLEPMYRLAARDLVDYIKQRFFESSWYELYDFVEFFGANYEDRDTMRIVLARIDRLLKEEKTPYRIINGTVTPITAEEEIKEIEKALSISDQYKPARDHVEKALKLMSYRTNPDHPNSIKESISAVDLLVQIILGKEGTLGKLIGGLSVHPALKKAFSNLYGWTSDEPGVRHPKFKEPLSCGESEARYMLITCSAFINYLIGISREKI